MKTYDAIIPLGGGRYNDGSLTGLSKQRLDAGIKLFKQGVAPKIFALGGKYSTYKPEAICFKDSGAKIRSEYLVKNGIPRENIILIEEGRDTIYEAIACRRACLKLGYNKLLIVTSDKHLKRALFVFRMVFGKDFTLAGYEVPCGDLIKMQAEKELLALFKSFFVKYQGKFPDLPWGRWYKENYYYYHQTELHLKHHQMGKQNSQAYAGVK